MHKCSLTHTQQVDVNLPAIHTQLGLTPPAAARDTWGVAFVVGPLTHCQAGGSTPELVALERRNLICFKGGRGGFLLACLALAIQACSVVSYQRVVGHMHQGRACCETGAELHACHLGHLWPQLHQHIHYAAPNSQKNPHHHHHRVAPPLHEQSMKHQPFETYKLPPHEITESQGVAVNRWSSTSHAFATDAAGRWATTARSAGGVTVWPLNNCTDAFTGAQLATSLVTLAAPDARVAVSPLGLLSRGFYDLHGAMVGLVCGAWCLLVWKSAGQFRSIWAQVGCRAWQHITTSDISLACIMVGCASAQCSTPVWLHMPTCSHCRNRHPQVATAVLTQIVCLAYLLCAGPSHGGPIPTGLAFPSPGPWVSSGC